MAKLSIVKGEESDGLEGKWPLEEMSGRFGEVFGATD